MKKWKVITLSLIGFGLLLVAPVVLSSPVEGQDLSGTRELVPVFDSDGTTESGEMAEMGGGGCSGCACCFPRTPDKIVNLNGYEDLSGSQEVVIFQVPMMDYLIISDLEVHLQGDVQGNFDVNIFLEEEDMRGNRVIKRCADLAPFHSKLGIAIKPGTKLLLSATPKAGGEPADGYYWHLNGYFWPAPMSHAKKMK